MNFLKNLDNVINRLGDKDYLIIIITITKKNSFPKNLNKFSKSSLYLILKCIERPYIKGHIKDVIGYVFKSCECNSKNFILSSNVCLNFEKNHLYHKSKK